MACCRTVCCLHEHAQINSNLDIVGSRSSLLDVRDPLLKRSWQICWHICPYTPAVLAQRRAANLQFALWRSIKEATLRAMHLDGEGRETVDEPGFCNPYLALWVMENHYCIILHCTSSNIPIGGADALRQAQK